MVKQASLLSELQSIVGKKHAREPRDERDCAVDGLSPRAIVEPGTYEEVAEVLRFANAERLAITPRGSGGYMHIGNIPSSYDIGLSIARLDAVIEYEPADLTVTCQAGIPFDVLAGKLRERGQMVPFGDDSGSGTPGGLLAANQSAYRAARDFTIGMRAVTGEGRTARAGGKVVKNVAGYDLCKLYIGSLGSLAVIVEATFKVLPLPTAREIWTREFETIEDACETYREANRRGVDASRFDIRHPWRLSDERLEPTAGYVVKIGIAGSRAGVERSLTELDDIAERTGGKPHDPAGLSAPGDVPEWATLADPLILRLSVLPTDLPALVRLLEAESPHPSLEIDPAAGAVVATWLGAGGQTSLVDGAHAAARRLGGHLLIQFCSPELKRQIDVFGPWPPSFPLMRAIKQQFDPNNVLSPGRFVGRL